ncbi:MAG: serine/threonine-protein kinase [Leptolyngbyaceae bacterium]|nr:serine/threonine-protein kinase [Leptolyngbyaceae bacterium]
MSYCLNPDCANPENPNNVQQCQSCGTTLLLNARYRIQQELGRGGFGTTFLAIDQSLPGHPSCVIKQLRPTLSSPQAMKMARDLFAREAQTLGKIGNHPQVPQLLNFFEESKEFYLVQEYIQGFNLQQEVKRSGPFSEAGVKQFLSEILPMIEYIHAQKVIHRDIKPANLIRREQDKKLVLIDFGAVKDKVNPERAGASEQTALTQYAIGTPGYAPPEQMAMRPTFASDIYALGVTCLFLLTGQSPKDMDYDPTTGELMWLEQVHISEHFSDVLQSMLEVSVRHRYQSATEVLRALDMVPYMDSLAEGMVSSLPTRSKNDPSPSHGSSQVSEPENTRVPPSSRLAAQIRARKNKSQKGAEITGPQSLGRRGGQTGGRSGGLQSQGAIRPSRALPKSASILKSSSGLTSDSVLAAYARGRRNFSSCDLSAFNLQQASLEGANFHEANFRQARLAKTNFREADLGGANLSQASLANAVLRDANLVGAFLTNADLANADLRGANLSYAHLSNANLRGANLCGADLTGAKVSEEQLSMARTNWKTVHPTKKRGIW